MRSPWSAQEPWQSQQNSWRHWLQVMCMHPWFFSMGRLHLGHCLVCAMIQFRFSLSALFLMSQVFTTSQATCRQAGSALLPWPIRWPEDLGPASQQQLIAMLLKASTS